MNTDTHELREIISIREQVPTISKALRLIVAGLREIPNEDFRVNMLTYGATELNHKSEEICYGCAATCTIQKLAGERLDSASINNSYSRATKLGFDPSELEIFERIIDQLRKGMLSISATRFFNISQEQENIVWGLISSFSGLTSNFTEDQLVELEVIATKLEEKGL